MVCTVAAARTRNSVSTCGMSLVTSFTDDYEDFVRPMTVSVSVENLCDAVTKSDSELLRQTRATDESDQPVYVLFLFSFSSFCTCSSLLFGRPT